MSDKLYPDFEPSWGDTLEGMTGTGDPVGGLDTDLNARVGLELRNNPYNQNTEAMTDATGAESGAGRQGGEAERRAEMRRRMDLLMRGRDDSIRPEQVLRKYGQTHKEYNAQQRRRVQQANVARMADQGVVGGEDGCGSNTPVGNVQSFQDGRRAGGCCKGRCSIL